MLKNLYIFKIGVEESGVKAFTLNATDSSLILAPFLAPLVLSMVIPENIIISKFNFTGWIPNTTHLKKKTQELMTDWYIKCKRTRGFLHTWYVLDKSFISDSVCPTQEPLCLVLECPNIGPQHQCIIGPDQWSNRSAHRDQVSLRSLDSLRSAWERGR